MRLLTTTLLSLLLTMPAYAQGTSLEGACRLVALHTPRADVAFIGDHAVPADLNPISGALGTVHIPITIDLAARFGIDVPLGADLEPDVAVIAVQPNGRVLYNGQDLSQNVTSVCGQMNADDGQGAHDGLGSSAQQ